MSQNFNSKYGPNGQSAADPQHFSEQDSPTSHRTEGIRDVQLVINAGSSSLKLACFNRGNDRPVAAALVDRIPGTARANLTWMLPPSEPRSQEIDARNIDDELNSALQLIRQHQPQDWIERIGVVSHRVVHGGAQFTQPTRLTPQAVQEIEKLSSLAPLHNPPALEGIAAAGRLFPDAPQYAVFDTAFFATLPDYRRLYAVPYHWFEEFGIRRYGFHGISHEDCARRTANCLNVPLPSLQMISCHLGAGCSLTATQQGTAVATSMGFTPLDGVIMKTRPGALDPGLLIHLVRSGRMTVDELYEALNRHSGLAGISATSGDLREVQQAADRGDARARLALSMFVDSVAGMIGRLATTLDRIDALVFTAGIGEHSPSIRSAICERVKGLGLVLDPELNLHAQPDAAIHSRQSIGAILVLEAREEAAMAKTVFETFHSAPS